jgi:hypothetical protein
MYRHYHNYVILNYETSSYAVFRLNRFKKKTITFPCVNEVAMSGTLQKKAAGR